MPYVPFSIPDFTPSSTPPTAFATNFTPSSTPPTVFGADSTVLANIAALKALATNAALAGAVRNVASPTPGETVQAWRYTLGVHADDVPGGFAQPTDYDEEDNAGYWQRIL